MEEVTFLRGGGGGLKGPGPHFGPVLIREGYSTTANGWADTISAPEGKVLVLLSGGGPSSFAQWVRGTPGAVVQYLLHRAEQERLHDDVVSAERLEFLAKAITQNPQGGEKAKAAYIADLERRLTEAKQ